MLSNSYIDDNTYNFNGWFLSHKPILGLTLLQWWNCLFIFSNNYYNIWRSSKTHYVTQTHPQNFPITSNSLWALMQVKFQFKTGHLINTCMYDHCYSMTNLSDWPFLLPFSRTPRIFECKVKLKNNCSPVSTNGHWMDRHDDTDVIYWWHNVHMEGPEVIFIEILTLTN